MPFVSQAQRRWAHTATGVKALGGRAKVNEWDTATAGKKLPERIGSKHKQALSIERKVHKSMGIKTG